MSKLIKLSSHPKWRFFEQYIFWVLLWLGSFGILYASLDYLKPNYVHEFLRERLYMAEKDWWRWTLYVHVASGILCLTASLSQYSDTVLKKYRALHKYLGRVYAYSIFLFVFPTGIILSFFAKGGIISIIGFLVLSVATFITALFGVRAILKKNLKKHKIWITRSFALISSAITFRILQLLLEAVGVPSLISYQLAVWLSLAINVLLGEYYLWKAKFRK